MDPAAAIAAATLALVVLLAVVRPRIGLTFSPGLAAALGVVVLLAARILAPADLVRSMAVQWRPLVTLTCIMVMTGVVQEVGAFERLTAWIERRARTRSATSTFTLVFALAVVTPALLNNDAAILILTPLVVSLVRRLYTGRAIAIAFAFAIFLAPGVAPFLVSNPMNMIVAELAGLRFNSYAAIMLPISLAGALVTYVVLRIAFGRALREAAPGPAGPPTTIHRHPAERAAVALLAAVFLAYPICATLGLEIWFVAVAGAASSLALGRAYRVAPVRKLASHVSLDILVFLWGIFLVVQGLRAVGAVELLRSIYGAAPDLGTIGVTSTLGSALIDNHPMALLNTLAIDRSQDAKLLLAALVGGDIGPRLLPIGSLAGLLWMDLLRRQGIAIGIRSFVRVGTLALVPTLAVSLALLWLL